MFSKIKVFFVGVEHDVEAIISNFTDTVSKLEAAAVAKAQEAERHLADAAYSSHLSATAKAAADKAQAVAKKIEALVA